MYIIPTHIQRNPRSYYEETHDGNINSWMTIQWYNRTERGKFSIRIQKRWLSLLKKKRRRKDRSSKSLNHKWWEPFRIKRQTRFQDYELQLPETICIHPIINICNLKKHNRSISNHESPPDIIDEQEEYEVKEIRKEKKDKY